MPNSLAVYSALDEVRRLGVACWVIFHDETRLLLRFERSEDWREEWFFDPLGQRHVYAVYSLTAGAWDELAEGQVLPLLRSRGQLRVEVADDY